MSTIPSNSDFLNYAANDEVQPFRFEPEVGSCHIHSEFNSKFQNLLDSNQYEYHSDCECDSDNHNDHEIDFKYQHKYDDTESDGNRDTGSHSQSEGHAHGDGFTSTFSVSSTFKLYSF